MLAPRAAAHSNVNDRILRLYLEHLLPEIAAPGDDGNYGSAAMNDVIILQARLLCRGGRAGWGEQAGRSRRKAGPRATLCPCRVC